MSTEKSAILESLDVIIADLTNLRNRTSELLRKLEEKK